MIVVASKRVQKQYNKLPKEEKKKVQKKLLALEQNPFIGKSLEGDLSGRKSLRAWPYRIIYSIDQDQKRIEVLDIRHRQGVYK